MKLQFIFLAVLLSLQLSLTAQNVTITGSALGAGGKTIELKTQADMISSVQKTLSKSLIDRESERFKMQTLVNQTTHVYLTIDNYVYYFYIEPNRTYEIKIDTFDYYQDEVINPFLKQIDLPVELLNVDKEDINVKMVAFNDWFDNYITQYQNGLFILHQKAYLDTLSMWSDSLFGKINNTYFQTFRKYTIAEIALTGAFQKRMYLADNYLLNKNINYHNEAYQSFFNNFFEKYLSTGAPKLNTKKLKTLLQNYNLAGILDSLGYDPALRDERIRELVFLKCMKDAFLSPDYNDKQVLDLLRRFSNYTKFPEHKEIAENLLNSLPIGVSGNMGTQFSLKDADGNVVGLNRFKDKNVLLMFYTYKCDACLDDFETLNLLVKKYHLDNVEFVAVSCDKEVVLFKHSMEELSKYPWTFLHYGGDNQMLSNYGVKTYPSYILLNEDGVITQNPVPSPSSKQFLPVLKKLAQ